MSKKELEVERCDLEISIDLTFEEGIKENRNKYI